MGPIDIVILCVLMVALGMFLALGIFFLVVYAATKEGKTKDPPAAEKEREDPCESCLRWSECNGADEECPRRL